jgi:outer membrane biosynthesis protein TonB
MLPSRYRGRYLLFIILSLLVHLSVIVALMWSAKDKRDEQMQDKTVTVTLKQKEEPKKEEPKKEEPKKEEPKKEEPKKEEPKKEEPKKEEPKKEEPKKEEPKKEEPKKVEPKKVEPKKEEPKKVEPKKEEPKKVEPKKVEPKKVEPKMAEPPPMIQDSLSEYAFESDDVLEDASAMARMGSMLLMDERTMSQLVVSTQSLDRKFDTRHFEGEVIKQELNFFQKQEFSEAMQQAFKEIEQKMIPVSWDGGRYYGEINFFVDIDGTIEKIVLKRSSGSEALDKSMIQALISTQRITMPNDPKVRKVMHLTKKLLYYSDKDMLR